MKVVNLVVEVLLVSIKMTPKQKHNFYKILQFIVLWVVFGQLYALVEYGLLGDSGTYPTTQNIYDPSDSFLFVFAGTLVLGAIVGLIETFGFNGFFKNRSFGIKILLKSLLYLVLIVLFLVILSFISTASYFNTSLLDEQVISSVFRFVLNPTFITIVIYIGVMFIITLFFAEIRNNLGMFVFANFVRGKYHKPRVEERIFMFMDMKSSTTIAENLGHIRYYELLNRYYSDMSDAIINTYGEIYQYVGDEVIITWPLENGLKNNNCIRCFYEIKLAIENKSEKYMDDFGLIPKFKAAIHCGKVTSGEVGKLKKEIVFSGDVLNTTSRIQECCNQYDAELLISDDLKEYLPLKKALKIEHLGLLTLKGKQNSIGINRVDLV
ncbi:adenylate/guanylate cyclase domain-containing protein [Fulvivirga lutea]|uniref:Adenylate/guanylate cyclase domain-containing protein n=1 Tax=Fulvivirga lutea TaxID=2810512 RepID=A0A975A0N7_9BACT|nr:adenylate/guanylate cyclase domain-containing protein [Fulvivirga lutea]QSE97390.1 adenylate/guanylate cyclase domain-containing protein [Fulvivirga lutea]